MSSQAKLLKQKRTALNSPKMRRSDGVPFRISPLARTRRRALFISPNAGQIKKTVTITKSRDGVVPSTVQAPDKGLFDTRQNRAEIKVFGGEGVSFRRTCVKNSERSIIPLLFWLGHVKQQERSNIESPSSVNVHLHSGYAVGFAMTIYWCFALRLELIFYLVARTKNRSLNAYFGYNLRFPSVVNWDSETVVFALNGDVDSMKMKLAAGEANPSDVVPNGSSLLHVCTCRSVQQTSSANLDLS